MIPSIANPTKFVEKYRMARIYFLWRFLPPCNTPDSFCRRFTRQNFSLDLQGGSFLLWDRNCKPFTKPWQGGDPKRDLSRQFVSQRQIPRGCSSCPWPRLANLWKIFLLRCQDNGRPAVQMRTSDASWNQMSVRLTTLLQSRRSFSHHSEVCPPSQNHSSRKLAQCSAGERKRAWNIHRIRGGIGSIERAPLSISWSLSYDVAEWFAHRSELFYHCPCHVYQGTIHADKVIAYLPERSEFEIIQHRNVKNVQEITPLRGYSPPFNAFKSSKKWVHNEEESNRYFNEWYQSQNCWILCCFK